MRGAITIAAAILLAAPGAANAQIDRPTGPTFFAPPAAKVAGTNGFTVYVFPTSRYNRRSNSVSLMARRGAAWTVYSATGKVSRNSMRVALKGFGSVDLRFDPSGRSRLIEQVGGCGLRLPTRVGTFRGEISFEGERSYTKVQVVRARSTAPPETIAACTGAQQPVPGSGARLSAGSNLRAASPGYSVFKGARDAPVGAVASMNNQERNPNIFRVVAKLAPSAAFTYSRDAAAVEPGPPFSGRAGYAVSGICRETTTATGTLRVQFPGLRSISLLGPDYRVTLADFTYRPPDPNPGPICAV